MQAPNAYGGMYDELLTSEVNTLRQAGKRVSRHRMIRTLQRAENMRALDAERVVNDYCQRGVVQTLLGDGPYDGWLTQQIESAYQANRGLSVTGLTTRLHKAHETELTGVVPQALAALVKVGIGWADANDIVQSYFARHALKHVLGPYPMAGVIVISVFELLLVLPIAWVLHMASLGLISHVSYAHAVQGASIFLLLVVGECLFRNWRKTRSKKRWDSYTALREELLERYCPEAPDASVPI